MLNGGGTGSEMGFYTSLCVWDVCVCVCVWLRVVNHTHGYSFFPFQNHNLPTHHHTEDPDFCYRRLVLKPSWLLGPPGRLGKVQGTSPPGFRLSRIGVESPESSFLFIHQVMLMPQV